MNDCPTIDQLFAEANLIATRAHLRACPACLDLVTAALDTGTGDGGDNRCGDAEILLAVVADRDLDERDRRSLEAHLAECARCSFAAHSLLLDSPLNTAAPTAKAPPIDTLQWSRPIQEVERRRGSSAVMLAAACGLVVSLVVAGALVFRGDRQTSRAPIADDEGDSGARVAEELEADDRTTALPGGVEKERKARPGPAKLHQAPPRLDPRAEKKRLVAAIRSRNYLAAYSICDRFITDGAIDAGTAAKCTLSACMDLNQDKTRKYFEFVNPQVQGDVAGVCARYGVELGDTDSDQAAPKSDEAESDPEPEATAGADETLPGAALMDALRRGQYARAYKICDLALLGMSTAAAKCMVAACQDRNAPRARRYRSKIQSATRRAEVTHFCNKVYSTQLD